MAGEICWGVVRGDGSVVNIYDDKAVALGWMRWGAFDKSYRASWRVDPYVRIAPGHYRPTVLNVLGTEVGALLPSPAPRAVSEPQEAASL